VCFAIESALSQTYRDVEVIVVDDGSADGTAERVIAEFGSRVHLLRLPENRGRSAARNAGIAAATGALIAFLDSDDLWLPHKLEQQVPAFADASVGLVHSRVALIDAAGAPRVAESDGIARAFEIAERRGYDYGDITETWCRMYTPAVVARRALLEQVGGFDPVLSQFEDWDLFWRVSRVARVVTIPAVLALVREHEGNPPNAWAADAAPWLAVNHRHLGLLDGMPASSVTRRARFNLCLNVALGEYWRGDLRTARRWFVRALGAYPSLSHRPRFAVWGSPLLHSVLPAAIAAIVARLAGFDAYAPKRRAIAREPSGRAS
jgi:glycosyltransferase involved in cell wall biosynthesis